ncbi:MAG: hypothetical protein WBG35_11190 [Acidobacteriaceae bacterium]
MIMGPLVMGVIALACVFGGALLGMFCRKHVPSEYQASESKEVVRLVMGLVVTTAAMALGLLVGSAKNFFDTQNAEMAQIAGNYILLDRVLTSYGPGASDARAALRSELADQLGESGTLERRNRAYMNIKEGVEMSDTIRERIQALSPADDSQRFLKQQSLALLFQLGQTRWLLFAQNAVPFPRFLMAMLISWLVLLFVSFGIFAPRNPLVLASLFASATAVCGAILLILAMYHPQNGLIRISDTPLRAAMHLLGI